MLPSRRHRALPSLLVSSLFALVIFFVSAAPARAEIKLNWSGSLQTDLRFRLNDISVGSWYARREAEPGISRNDNIFRLKLVATSGRFSGVAELDFAYYGYALKLDGFEDLYRPEIVDSFRVRARQLYIQANNLFVEGLDLRIGQQVVAWGVGDQFNPTNVLNPPDLEDPLLFGQLLASPMVKLDYSPDGNYIFSGVMVPIFRPALLPRTAALGAAFVDRLPFTSASLRHRVHTENWFIADTGNYPTAVESVRVVQPEFSYDNIQWAARVAGNVLGQDLALMFFYGRSTLPQPFLNVARLDATKRCDTADPTQCVNGTVYTNTGLYFPRFWMLGFNASGELPNPLSLLSKKIKGFGYRLEVGVFFPEAVSMAVVQRELAFQGGMPQQAAGEYLYPKGQRPRSVEDTPFAKWTVGLDYTFTSNLYLNVQWVHGLIDEFGAGGLFQDGDVVRAGGVDTSGDPTLKSRCALKVLTQNQGVDQDFSECAFEILKPRINDYLVLGMDIKFLDQKGLLRLFVLWDLIGVYEERWDRTAKARTRTHHGPFSDKGFSMTVFPELTYNFGKGLELSVGALLNFGKQYSKFGDPAVGGHQVWTRARFGF